MRTKCRACGYPDPELQERVAALMAENAELAAHIAVLVALDEKRHEAEKQFGRQLVEARGRVGDRKADL